MKHRRISIPHEHGGYITLLGATLAGAGLAQARLPALGYAVVATAAFFARAPLEQIVLGRPAAWDREALVGLGAVVLGSAALLGWASPLAGAIALGWAAAIIGSSLGARLGKHHRHAAFELIGMATLGVTAGAIALAGGAPWRSALAAAVVVGAHAAVAVPLVRTELRPRERDYAERAELGSALLLVAAAAILFVLGTPWAVLALAPRALHLGSRRLRLFTGLRPNAVGVREAIELALVVTLLVAVLR